MIEHNRRIAKNTLMLYIRMAVAMMLAFFITRKLLAILGEDDYGLVSIVGGVVTMFAFLSGTMQVSASRFFNFELGRNDLIKLKQTFNLTQMIYGGIILLVLLLSETVGLWFLENKLIIPVERQEAAFWFFQFALLAFLLNVAAIPYSALIISHEDMKTYAWISIGDSIGRLVGVYLLYFGVSDSRLPIYGVLLGLMAFISFLGYAIICLIKYPESRFSFYWNKTRFLELISFSSWNLFGASSGLFTNVFINILLNNYFSSAIVTARAIATQVSTSVSGFTQNFMIAVNPQIIKYYAAGEFEHMHTLAMRASRLSYFLLFFFSLPVLVEMDFVLGFWLEEVPSHTVLFARLALVQVLIDTLSYPLMTLAQASGQIALYQSVVGMMLWLTLPIVYLFFFLGCVPESAGMVALGVSAICLGLRLIFVRRCAKLCIRTFLQRVILPVILTSSLAALLPLAMFMLPLEKGWLHFGVVGIVSVTSTGLVILRLGLAQNERMWLLNLLKMKVRFLNLR